MAEGGDCGVQANRGRGRGLAQGKPHERDVLRKPDIANINNHLNFSPRGSSSTNNDCCPENSIAFTKEMAENCKEFSPRNVSKPISEIRSDKVPQMRTLRHDAPEFVPRSSLTISSSAQLDTSNHVDGFSSDNFVNVNLMGQLKELIDNLSIDPGQYDTIQESILELLISYMTSDDVLKEVVDTIFTRSVTDPNLAYSGARLCNYLSQNVLSDEGVTVFRAALLNRCQTEVTKEKLLNTSESQMWFRGMIHFIGELFIHLELASNEGVSQRCRILGLVLLGLLDTLLGHPGEENCKCVAQVLKFTGAALEEDFRNSPDAKLLDNLMKRIETLWNNNISRSTKEQFKKILDLRSSNWGSALSPRVSHEEPFIGDYSCGEPVLYGPDGQPLTSEESQFLESNQRFYDDDYGEYPEFGPNEWSTEDDQMDDEIAAAYEEFLAQHPGCNQFQNS